MVYPVGLTVVSQQRKGVKISYTVISVSIKLILDESVLPAGQ